MPEVPSQHRLVNRWPPRWFGGRGSWRIKNRRVQKAKGGEASCGEPPTVPV